MNGSCVMHRIEKENYGYKLIFGELISTDEMKVWADDARKALDGQSGKFGVFVDMRTLKPLAPETQSVMVEGQKLCKERGMERSVVILSNALLTMQFKRLAKDSGIYAWERYVDASASPDWEKKGEAWITAGTDPDKEA